MLNTKLLSPRTLYGTYLIIHFADRAYGLDSLPSEVSLEVGKLKSQGTVYLCRCDSMKQQSSERPCCVRSFRRSKFCSTNQRQVPVERKDSWMEIELGQFYDNDEGGEEVVRMCLKEVLKGEHLKGGLILEGIELRSIQLH